MTFGDALIYSLLGIGVVFFALVLLMGIIRIMTALGDWEEKRQGRAAASEAPVPSAAPAAPGHPGPSFTREVKLYDTDPRSAAMIMAIIAETTKIPLNRLHFISIREVKEENEK